MAPSPASTTEGYRRVTPPAARVRLRRVIRSLEQLLSEQLVAEAGPVKWRRQDADALAEALAALRAADPG
jgi:hypothetical protein